MIDGKLFSNEKDKLYVFDSDRYISSQLRTFDDTSTGYSIEELDSSEEKDLKTTMISKGFPLLLAGERLYNNDLDPPPQDDGQSREIGVVPKTINVKILRKTTGKGDSCKTILTLKFSSRTHQELNYQCVENPFQIFGEDIAIVDKVLYIKGPSNVYFIHNGNKCNEREMVSGYGFVDPKGVEREAGYCDSFTATYEFTIMKHILNEQKRKSEEALHEIGTLPKNSKIKVYRLDDIEDGEKCESRLAFKLEGSQYRNDVKYKCVEIKCEVFTPDYAMVDGVFFSDEFDKMVFLYEEDGKKCNNISFDKEGYKHTTNSRRDECDKKKSFITDQSLLLHLSLNNLLITDQEHSLGVQGFPLEIGTVPKKSSVKLFRKTLKSDTTCETIVTLKFRNPVKQRDLKYKCVDKAYHIFNEDRAIIDGVIFLDSKAFPNDVWMFDGSFCERRGFLSDASFIKSPTSTMLDKCTADVKPGVEYHFVKYFMDRGEIKMPQGDLNNVPKEIGVLPKGSKIKVFRHDDITDEGKCKTTLSFQLEGLTVPDSVEYKCVDNKSELFTEDYAMIDGVVFSDDKDKLYVLQPYNGVKCHSRNYNIVETPGTDFIEYFEDVDCIAKQRSLVSQAPNTHKAGSDEETTQSKQGMSSDQTTVANDDPSTTVQGDSSGGSRQSSNDNPVSVEKQMSDDTGDENSFTVSIETNDLPWSSE